jgi:hypothetical protein
LSTFDSSMLNENGRPLQAARSAAWPTPNQGK